MKSINKKTFFIFTLLILILFFYSQEIIHIYRVPVSSWSELDLTADCAVVLTGATGRVREGFDLLENHKVKKLIVSGVFVDASYEDIFPYWPYYRYVNKEDVILERRSQTTFGNVVQSLVLVDALKCKSIFLVTSQLHMYRAHRLFKAYFPPQIEIIEYAVPNSKSELSLVALSFEGLKSLFYYFFSLVPLQLT